MTEPIRFLTVLQPVASAMVSPNAGGFGDDGGFVPAKPIENRKYAPRNIPREGLLVAVHAGLRWWGGPDDAPNASPTPEGLAWVRERWPAMPAWPDLPLGVVVGCVRVRAAIDLRKPPKLWAVSWSNVAETSPWKLGPVCWVIDRAWRLEHPIPRRGMVGFGIADGEVEKACRAAGARTA